jgi:hypothetical protein
MNLRPKEIAGTIAQVDDPGAGFELQRGESVVVAQKGTPLLHGDFIVTSQPAGRLAFSFADGSTVSISQGGSLRIQAYRDKGKLITLENGYADFKISPQKKPFRVTTQHGSVTVVGTAFTIDTSNSSMSLDVTEGVVDIENLRNHKVTVRAGEEVVARKDLARIHPTIKFLPAADTGIMNAHYATLNYGSAPELGTVRQARGPIADCFLKFELPSVPDNIVHASARLYCMSSRGNGPKVTAYQTTGDTWKEDTITWAATQEEQADIIGPPLDTWLAVPATYHTIKLDDTALQALTDQSPFSLRFMMAHDQRYTGAQFASREHPDEDKRPTLIFELGGPE